MRWRKTKDEMPQQLRPLKWKSGKDIRYGQLNHSPGGRPTVWPWRFWDKDLSNHDETNGEKTETVTEWACLDEEPVKARVQVTEVLFGKGAYKAEITGGGVHFFIDLMATPEEALEAAREQCALLGLKIVEEPNDE